jgi:hypothetical protein
MIYLQTLQPLVFDSGRVVNDDVSDLVHKLEREIRSVRTVTHTTTSSWKYAHELGIEISYSPPSATGISTFILFLFSWFCLYCFVRLCTTFWMVLRAFVCCFACLFVCLLFCLLICLFVSLLLKASIPILK